MPHPHILNKSFTQITETTRFVLERVYSQPSGSLEDVHLKFNRARGVMDLWAELTFDMGASQHINLSAQNNLDRLVLESDTAELARWDLPPRQR